MLALREKGVGRRTPLAELPVEIWDKAMAVNARGTFLCLKHELLQIQELGGGAIVNIASVDGGMADIG